MIAMQGVPSSLILRNASWVRQQANSMLRNLPANVEKADLIQVGLIAVAQAALAFEWEGDADSDEATQAFVRYARMRVKGAMLDELRQMDHLGRAERRKVKVIEMATERWLSRHGSQPTAAELARACNLSVQEVFDLRHAARTVANVSVTNDPEFEGAPLHEAATAQDEVEARVDTGMLLQRLEPFFAALPERERRVIDAYLGLGIGPVELAKSLEISPSRVTQLFNSVCHKIGKHLRHGSQRSIGRPRAARAARFEHLTARREAELAEPPSGLGWGEWVQEALAHSTPAADGGASTERLATDSIRRWDDELDCARAHSPQAPYSEEGFSLPVVRVTSQRRRTTSDDRSERRGQLPSGG